VFNVGSGNDVISAFNKGNLVVGSTVIARHHQLYAYGFSDWNALQAAISDNVAGNAVIQLSATDSVELIGSRRPLFFKPISLSEESDAFVVPTLAMNDLGDQ
jgi:hypothetical protein